MGSVTISFPETSADEANQLAADLVGFLQHRDLEGVEQTSNRDDTMDIHLLYRSLMGRTMERFSIASLDPALLDLNAWPTIDLDRLDDKVRTLVQTRQKAIELVIRGEPGSGDPVGV
jgi:hypothetical protein